MTNLALVKHEEFIKGIEKGIRRSPVAVSTSYSALVEYCKDEHNSEIDKIGCRKSIYYTIQNSDLLIIPSKH